MEVMGCLPLSVPTLDPRSYRIGPRHGKKREPSGHCRRCAGGGSRGIRAGRFKEAREVFDHVALDEGLIVFVTLPAYRLLDWVGR
jgi:hypothetical protein